MELDSQAMDLLRPVADSLRRALRGMDEEVVPAPLRPLADSSARRLPPPLLRRALVELDGSDWLRAEVLAEDDLDPASPGGLFVARPEGWEKRLGEMIEEVSEESYRRERRDLEAELASALERIAQLEEALKEGSSDVAAAERRARDRLRNDVEAAERGRRQAESRVRDEARESARLAAVAERLVAERDSVTARVDGLRRLLEKERRASGESESLLEPRGWFPQDPTAMADELDRISTAVRRAPRPERSVDSAGVTGPPAALRLPDGTRPDRAESIHWLMGRNVRWLIDGYNVAFQISGAPDSVTRSRVVAEAGRLAGLAALGSMVVVVFDSSVDTSSMPADRRVRVVFARSADEWIVEHAAPGAVVVSSDRWVREQAEESGALGVWSEALTSWIERGPSSGATIQPR